MSWRWGDTARADWGRPTRLVLNCAPIHSLEHQLSSTEPGGPQEGALLPLQEQLGPLGQGVRQKHWGLLELDAHSYPQREPGVQTWKPTPIKGEQGRSSPQPPPPGWSVTALEAGGPRPRCQQGWRLLETGAGAGGVVLQASL